jgi:hypothetical protein
MVLGREKEPLAHTRREEEDIVEVLRLGQAEDEDEFRGEEKEQEPLDYPSDPDRTHEIQDGTDRENPQNEKGEVKGVIVLGEFRLRKPLELLRDEEERVSGEKRGEDRRDEAFSHIFALESGKGYNKRANSWPFPLS